MKVLCCDDDWCERDSTWTRLERELRARISDVQFVGFDGLVNGRRPTVPQVGTPEQRTAALLRAVANNLYAVMNREACDVLLMDRLWWPEECGNENWFGVELLEDVAARLIQAPLSLDRIFVVSRYVSTQHARRPATQPEVGDERRQGDRLEALAIPRHNVFSRYSLSDEELARLLRALGV